MTRDSKAEVSTTRTSALAGLKAPSRSGRTAVLVSCGGLVLLLGSFGALCTGLNVAAATLYDPVVAFVAGTAALGCALPYFFAIRWIDRNDPEPLVLALSAVAWGAVLATGLSIMANEAFGAVALAAVGDEAFAAQLTASISAPLVEETTKGFALVVLYLFFWRDFDNVLDGVVYGALVGLGFAASENFTYYANTESIGGVVVMTMVRGIVIAVGLHPAFTAITGAAVGAFRVMRRGWLRWLIPPAGLAGAMFAHFVWNTFSSSFAYSDDDPLAVLLTLPFAVTFLQVPFMAMVLLAAAFSLRHEDAMIRTYLATEKAPVLNDGELRHLVPAYRRFWHGLGLLWRGDVAGWWKARLRNGKLVRLAFEKWHMDKEAEGGDLTEGRDHALAVRDLRKELTELG